MTATESELHLDGNAAAGWLADVFCAEITTAEVTCANCGSLGPVGSLTAYGLHMGVVLRCPGCDQLIPDGVPHVVAWPAHSGVDERRHWHKSCWNAKDRRTTRVQRSRNAPRF